MRARTWAATASAGLLLGCVGMTPAAAEAPSVTGGGAGTFADGPFAGDRVQLNVTSGGRFSIVHQSASGGVFAHLVGDIDCASVRAGSATLTGVITGGYDDVGVDPVGYRVSIHLTDGVPDTFGLNVQFLSGDELAPCTGSPQFVLPAEAGGFQLRG